MDGAIVGTKFFEKLELHVYSQVLQGTAAYSKDFGGADCVDLRGGRSRIRLMWFAPSAYGGYKLPAAIAHEMGHAFHYWRRCFSNSVPYGPAFRAFWERQVSGNHSAFDPTQ